MGYVAVAILVLLIVAAAVTFFVLSAARKQRPAAIAAPDDETPAGDTDQHADHAPRERGPAGGSAGGEAGLGGEAEGSRGDLPGAEPPR